MRIISPFPSVPSGVVAIFIPQGPYAKEVVNGENFYKVPYEDPHALGLLKGYIHVEAGGEFESAIYQVSSAVTQVTTGGNTLVRLKKAEWPRNKHT
jgi:hypothetical protein